LCVKKSAGASKKRRQPGHLNFKFIESEESVEGVWKAAKASSRVRSNASFTRLEADEKKRA
jgi:hypothetical protein